MVVSALLVAVGFAMLYFGASWLVSGSVSIAKKLRINQLVIGLTIVAYGTSTPEMAVSIAAALQGQTDIMLGNVVGSNIVNIGIIMGLSAVLLPMLVSRRIIRKEIPIMIGITFVLIALSIDDEISQLDGAILVSGIVVFSYYIYAQAKKDNSANASKELEHITVYGFPRSVLLIAIGIVLLFVGSFVTVDNAVIIAQELGISERVIGLTIIAIGTSLPELITSIVAMRKGYAEITVGNIIGSNIYNILAILGIASVLTGIAVNPAMFMDYWILVAFSLVLLPIMRTGFVVSRIEGSALVAAYVAYLILLFLLR